MAPQEALPVHGVGRPSPLAVSAGLISGDRAQRLKGGPAVLPYILPEDAGQDRNATPETAIEHARDFRDGRLRASIVLPRLGRSTEMYEFARNSGAGGRT